VKRFRLAPEARDDIKDIWSYIASDNLESATRVREDIRDACRRLARHPYIGHRRDDLTTPRGHPVLAGILVPHHLSAIDQTA